MTSLYNLNVFCTDGTNTYTHNVWKDSLDTPVCPFGITGHTVVYQEIVDTIASNVSTVTDDISGTHGYYRSKGISFDVPAGPSSEQIAIGTHSYPYPIRIHTFTITPTADNIGDTFSFLSAKDTVVGILTSGVTGGNTLNVNSTVVSNVKPGFEVNLYNGVTGQNLGECYSVDTTTNTITVQNAVTGSFAPGTYVRITLKRIENVLITTTEKIIFGSGTAGSSLVPANIVGTIMYQNNTSSSKKFSMFAECSY